MIKKLSLLVLLLVIGTPQPSESAPKVSAKVAAPAVPAKVKVKFRAGVIRGNGEVVPVSRTEFIVMPFLRQNLEREFAAKNKAGPAPVKPEEPFGDPKYQEEVCYDNGFCTRETPQATYDKLAEQFARDTEKYEQDIKAWEAKAYVGMDAAIAKLLATRPALQFKTDLSGESLLSLPEGTWYFSGSFQMLSGRSQVFWINVPFKVDKSTQIIELSNDNGKVMNEP